MLAEDDDIFCGQTCFVDERRYRMSLLDSSGDGATGRPDTAHECFHTVSRFVALVKSVAGNCIIAGATHTQPSLEHQPIDMHEDVMSLWEQRIRLRQRAFRGL